MTNIFTFKGMLFHEILNLNISYLWASLVAQWQRIHLPMQGMQETWVQSLGWEDPLEEKMATYCSILV